MGITWTPNFVLVVSLLSLLLLMMTAKMIVEVLGYLATRNLFSEARELLAINKLHGQLTAAQKEQATEVLRDVADVARVAKRAVGQVTVAASKIVEVAAQSGDGLPAPKPDSGLNKIPPDGSAG